MHKNFKLPFNFTYLQQLATHITSYIRNQTSITVSLLARYIDIFTEVCRKYSYEPLTNLYDKIDEITSPKNEYLSALKNIILGCILVYYPNFGLARLVPTSILTVHQQKFVALELLFKIIFLTFYPVYKRLKEERNLSFVHNCCEFLLKCILSLIHMVRFPLELMAFLTMPHKYSGYHWECIVNVYLTFSAAISTGSKDFENCFLNSQTTSATIGKGVKYFINYFLYSLTSSVNGDKDRLLTYIKYLYSDSASITQPACEYVRIYAPYISGSHYLYSGLCKGLKKATTDFEHFRSEFGRLETSLQA